MLSDCGEDRDCSDTVLVAGTGSGVDEGQRPEVEEKGEAIHAEKGGCSSE